MTAHVFLRYVAPENEEQIRLLGFRKFTNETEAPIWMLHYVAPDNPLRGMDTEQVLIYLRNHVLCGQIFEATMWGACPD